MKSSYYPKAPLLIKVMLVVYLITLSNISIAQTDFEDWGKNFKKALKSGRTDLIKVFFEDEFGNKEIESWKYEMQGGNLDLEACRLIKLTEDAILLYIPTKTQVAYNGENHNEYFDFIYRIYRTELKLGRRVITERSMADFTPNFKNYILNVYVDTETNTFIFECEITLDLTSPNIIFRLAKNFEIIDFKVNNSKIDYNRIGYYVYCKTKSGGNCNLSIKGKLQSPNTNNQFISMNDKCFFIRFGGFAAIPSPPADNSGRKHFSDDSTNFTITYNYPNDYTLLQYGDFEDKATSYGKKQTKTAIAGEWKDNIAFYAQNNWDKKEIIKENTRIGFYFNDDDHKERDYIIEEVDTLLQWLNNRFENFSNFSINFVVLDNFVKNGLLNDSHSIIAQNAEIIGSGGMGYLHEIAHCAPQPFPEDINHLWIKEGFTNFLSYEYLVSQKKELHKWKELQRTIIHYFHLFDEPLINITSTSIPTYWLAYSKAPWVYRMLEAVIGEDAFKRSLLELGKMDGITLKNVDEYIDIFEKVAGKDLSQFTEQWLYRKENPILNVQGQLTKDRNGSVVSINVKQSKPYFKLPLEVEIKTENETYRRTIQVEDKETNFDIPVNGNEVSIRYDPDARLFAVIKDHKKSFSNEECGYRIPDKIATYVSDKDSEEVNVWFVKNQKGISIHKKTENLESVLELDEHLSPITYIKNGEVIFRENMVNKTISFNEKQYDIAEPLYPEEFTPFLYAMLDWKNIEQLSMLCVPSQGKWNYISYCEKISSKKDVFTLKLRNNKTEFISKDGLPQSFINYDGELFVLKEKAVSEKLQQIDSLIEIGRYSLALTLIDQCIKEIDKSYEDVHQRLSMKKYDIISVKNEYTLSRNDVFEELKKKIPDISIEDINKWDEDYSLEYYIIEGEKKYYYNCVYDLLLSNKQAAIRAGEINESSYDYSKYPLETINRVKNDSLFKREINIGFSYFQNLEVIPMNGILRAWIPFVRENKFQNNIQILESNITNFSIPNKDDLTSMIYFEHQVKTGYKSNEQWDSLFTSPKYSWMYSIKKPSFITDSTFLIQFVYQYTSWAYYNEIHKNAIQPYKTTEDTYQKYTTETLSNPHTEYLIKLAKDITGNEKNPYLRARLIYQWICENIVWTDPKAIIGDLSEYTAKYKRGDCNAKSELFISLCRISGIPARSQGGWLVRPNGRHAQHTWAQMYFEPYGWLPVDVTFGRGLINNDDQRLRFFHFGNCTPYRLVIYDDHSQTNPQKEYPCIYGGGSQLGVFQWEGGDMEPYIKIDSYVQTKE